MVMGGVGLCLWRAVTLGLIAEEEREGGVCDAQKYGYNGRGENITQPKNLTSHFQLSLSLLLSPNVSTVALLYAHSTAQTRGPVFPSFLPLVLVDTVCCCTI
jgi:hypothetical protein